MAGAFAIVPCQKSHCGLSLTEMLILTCDGNESVGWAEVRPLDDLPDSRYQADVEAVLGPALQEAHMHQRPPAPATPLWWMHRPPSLAQFTSFKSLDTHSKTAQWSQTWPARH